MKDTPSPLLLSLVIFLFFFVTRSAFSQSDFGICYKTGENCNDVSYTASTAETDGSSRCPPAVIYDSVRTFRLRLRPGRLFLGFYFTPCHYYGRSIADAVFSIAVGRVTLLDNFSPYAAAKARNLTDLYFEFSVYVTEQAIDLTFAPSKNHAGAYAFQNSVSAWSVPETFTAIAPGYAVQTFHRLNVGGSAISPDDYSGLPRAWVPDTPYVRGRGFGVAYAADPNVTVRYLPALPEYIAPVGVYTTARSMGPSGTVNLNYNLTWAMPVDCGFSYLVRLHLCEIASAFVKPNMRVFNVYVDGAKVDGGVDVVAESGGVGKPMYKDYTVAVAGCGGTGTTDMVVELQPDAAAAPQYLDATLNGLEVFKIQDGNGSLAGPRVWY